MNINIDNLSIMRTMENKTDQEKTDIATAIINMIENDELALSVLRYRCKYCGKFLNEEYGTCYCTADD